MYVGSCIVRGCGGASPEGGGDGAIVDLACFCRIGERGFEGESIGSQPV